MSWFGPTETTSETRRSRGRLSDLERRRQGAAQSDWMSTRYRGWNDQAVGGLTDQLFAPQQAAIMQGVNRAMGSNRRASARGGLLGGSRALEMDRRTAGVGAQQLSQAYMNSRMGAEGIFGQRDASRRAWHQGSGQSLDNLFGRQMATGTQYGNQQQSGGEGWGLLGNAMGAGGAFALNKWA